LYTSSPDTQYKIKHLAMHGSMNVKLHEEFMVYHSENKFTCLMAKEGSQYLNQPADLHQF